MKNITQGKVVQQVFIFILSLLLTKLKYARHWKTNSYSTYVIPRNVIYVYLSMQNI